MIPIAISIEVFFIVIIFIEKEDLSYKLVEPIIVVIFYTFGMFGTAYMILCDYWKGIAFYNPELKAAYE